MDIDFEKLTDGQLVALAGAFFDVTQQRLAAAQGDEKRCQVLGRLNASLRNSFATRGRATLAISYVPKVMDADRNIDVTAKVPKAELAKIKVADSYRHLPLDGLKDGDVIPVTAPVVVALRTVTSPTDVRLPPEFAQQLAQALQGLPAPNVQVDAHNVIQVQDEPDTAQVVTFERNPRGAITSATIEAA